MHNPKLPNIQTVLLPTVDLIDCLSGDDLFSTLKLSQSSANSDFRHFWHFLDSDCLPVLETLQRTSYSKPLPAVPNATARSSHSNCKSFTLY